MEAFLSLDRSLFLLINHIPHIWIVNVIALFLSGVGQAGVIWLVIALWLFWKEERHNHWFFLPVVLATVFSWVVSELVIKSAVGRMRPTLDIGAIIVGDGAANSSFPSSHATMSFALAYVLASIEPRFRMFFFLIATGIALSRIYLGVHFPSDVIVGALLGLFIGHVSIALSKRLKKT